MYLHRLEIQGFKTFAQRTILEFVPDAQGERGITAIVGPNGSGKSNIADALRWVMGEQSLKTLRGKKSEDVIFSGTPKRARSGFAEASFTLIKEENDSSEGIPSEVMITRRLYRDGDSSYEINRQSARLQDVVLLLSQCGIGQRTYSVIGQGMVDNVLVASPSERKEFFDEAFGVRQFQLKRNSAMHKVDESKKNLAQTEALLKEIEPRLTTLDRHVRRLEQRETLERERNTLERAHYGSMWREICSALATVQTLCTKLKEEEMLKEAEAKKLEAEFESMERATSASEGFQELRDVIDKIAEKRAKLRERQIQLEAERNYIRTSAEKSWTPLPLSKIIEWTESVCRKHSSLDEELSKETPNINRLREHAKELREMSNEMVQRLQKPAPESVQQNKSQQELHTEELLQISQAIASLAEESVKAQAKIAEWNKNEEQKRSHLFKVQHILNSLRQSLHALDRTMSDAEVERARIETRRDAFYIDLRTHAPNLESELDDLKNEQTRIQADAGARLQRLRSQLEWIGAIDPQTLKEHAETKERFTFLSTQSEDLKASLTNLEVVITELDRTIKERSTAAFATLNTEFAKAFKTLFEGGEANLVELEVEPKTDENGMVINEDEEIVAGIDIQVTPPGKRFKSINLLSGGERALTSIALICAIMATNPSSFVVLDEVDAALDEANSKKFAEIIRSLSYKTQFIIVTHNRATMSYANILYGVTMGDDGVSRLLSVKLDDVEKMKEKNSR